MHGNTFNKFYRYPNPSYVEPREYTSDHVKTPADRQEQIDIVNEKGLS